MELTEPRLIPSASLRD